MQSALLVIGLLLSSASVSSQVPQVSIQSPSSVLLGESFTFELSLDNTSEHTIGYDPVLELILPGLPENEDDSDIFPVAPTLCYQVVEVSYLGNPVYFEFVGFFDRESGRLLHPITNEFLNGPAGSGLYLLHYPLSSIAPNQPAPVLSVDAKMHRLAPIAPQGMSARGFFNYGADPSGQSAAIFGEQVEYSITPSLLNIRKTVSYQESETATGPSFPGKWRLIGNVAREATLQNLEFADELPDNFWVTHVNIVRPVDGNLSLLGPERGGSLTASWASVAGSAQNSNSEILIEVDGYVPEFDAGNHLVLSPTTGENTAQNQFTSSYQFERVGLDPEGGFQINTASNTLVVDALTLAVQKDASVVADILPAGISPLDTVEFVLNIQVSDFKAVDQLRVEEGARTAAGLLTEADVLGDALTFDSGFIPTYRVTMGGATVMGDFSTDNYTVTANPADHPAGTSRITFNLSQQLIDDSHFSGDGVFTGAHLQEVVSVTGTTAQIRYRATIDTDFDSPDSGDASVDIGDYVFNDVDVWARDLVDGIKVGDQSGVALKMQPLQVAHTIERIVSVEGVVTEQPAETPYISPGDEVTFALRFSIPTGDVEDLVVRDFLPYSLLSVTDVNGDGASVDALAFNPVVDDSPAVGELTYGSADEYQANYAADGAPDFTVSVVDNSFTLTYGSIDSPSGADADNNGVYEFELYYTLAAGTDELPDGFRMTSLAQLTHGTTNAGADDRRDYTGLLFSRSVPVLTKGVIACDNVTAQISPAAPGVFENAGANGHLTHARAGDLVTFAITVKNTGSDPISVLSLEDALPTGFDADAARIVSVRRADGAAMTLLPAVDGLANTADEAALFAGALMLDSSIAENYLSASTGALGSYGTDTLVLVIEVPIIDEVAPAVRYSNVASAEVWYAAGVPASGAYAQVSDSALVDLVSIEMEKTLVTGYTGDDLSTVTVIDGDTETDIFTIGEIVTYDVTLEVPEGVASNVVLSDTLPAGLTPFAIDGVRAQVISIDSQIHSSQLAVGASDANSAYVTVSSGAVYFDFGTLSRAVTPSNTVQTITVRLHALVADDTINTQGLQQLNTAQLTWEGWDAQASSSFTVVRPNLTLDKTMQVLSGGAVQAGSTMQVQLTLTNLGDATAVSAAHDFVLEDLLQSEFFDGASIVEVDTPEGYLFETITEADGVKVRYSGGSIARGATHTFRFYVDLIDDLYLLTSLENSALLTATSLPGSPFSLVESTEVVDDLSQLGTAFPTITKALLGTSESHTSEQPLRVTIGEQVAYRLRVDVPDGIVPAIKVLDRVPAGMDFVGENTDAELAFPGQGYAISGPMGALMRANLQGVVDSDPTPSSSVGADGDGREITFNFNSITNPPDGDDSNDYFYIDLELVVLDVPSVVGFGDTPSELKNRSRVLSLGSQRKANWSRNVNASVAEPHLLLAKKILESGLEGGGSLYGATQCEQHGGCECV